MLSNLALSAYRIMWIIVSFDIPTCDRVCRKKAAQFRKDLIGDGFNMFQYSVYLRHCFSRENADAHIARVRGFFPGIGSVSIMRVTDKQFGDIITLIGKHKAPPPSPDRLFDDF